jgi:hypothetical protein
VRLDEMPTLLHHGAPPPPRRRRRLHVRPSVAQRRRLRPGPAPARRRVVSFSEWRGHQHAQQVHSDEWDRSVQRGATVAATQATPNVRRLPSRTRRWPGRRRGRPPIYSMSPRGGRRTGQAERLCRWTRHCWSGQMALLAGSTGGSVAARLRRIDGFRRDRPSVTPVQSFTRRGGDVSRSGRHAGEMRLAFRASSSAHGTSPPRRARPTRDLGADWFTCRRNRKAEQWRPARLSKRSGTR